MDYLEFLNKKSEAKADTGFEVSELNDKLKPFQAHIIKIALKKGCYAIFADTGLGKTFMQLEWAHRVNEHTNKPVLILAPLAVSGQTIKEGLEFNIEVEKLKNNVENKIYITNYEQLKNIDCSVFSGIVLDESSILKNYTGALKTLILESFKNTPYKLACTATPSPNDDLELGNHAEFLNITSSQDMRAKYFTTEKSRKDGNKYRLKKHAVKDFFAWVNSWAVMLSNPSDIGFSGAEYNLPKLNMINEEVEVCQTDYERGRLFKPTNVSATEFKKELRDTLEQRMQRVADIANSKNETFLIWIGLDVEGQVLRKLIPDAVEVTGSDKLEYKENTLLGFAQNKHRVLITKKKIAQYGLNFQYVKNPNMIFASLDFSFEGTYQAIRRMYRFGQTNEVNVHLITTPTMGNVKKTIETKEANFIRMRDNMVKLINTKNEMEIKTKAQKTEILGDHKLQMGDSVELIKEIKDREVDFTFFSPPFANMYVFSDGIQDMSNCSGYDEFMTHFEYIVPELARITRDGRMVAMHIMQFTTLKGADGYYSIVDFRGDLIRMFQKYGFYFHMEVTIRKDPQLAAIRTKNHQLMHGTTKKNSLVNRAGLADYIIVMRKGKDVDLENKVNRGIPFEAWCKYAEPIWDDIDESDTVKYRDARDAKDERHITATQIEPIKRLLMMYTNEGDTCYTPFSGSGTELSQFIKYNCKAIAHELKESYFNHSLKVAKGEVENKKQLTLF